MFRLLLDFNPRLSCDILSILHFFLHNKISGGLEMKYVDGFVLPVPAKNLPAYRRMAQRAGKIWKEHGALEYLECVGDDLETKMGKTFPGTIKARPGETVIFSWIIFKSRAHRDRVNAKVIKDPRLTAYMDPKSMPFDFKRMVYGGFKVLVEA